MYLKFNIEKFYKYPEFTIEYWVKTSKCSKWKHIAYVVKKDSINKKFNVKFYINGKLKSNFFKKFQLTKTKGGSLETKIAGARASVKKRYLKISKCGKSKTKESKNSQLTKTKDGSVRKKIAPILKKTNNKKEKKIN